MQLLNGMLFFITVLLLAIDFYHRWTDGDSVTLLGRPYFCRICFLPVVPPALGCSEVLQVRLGEECALLTSVAWAVECYVQCLYLRPVGSPGR
jgi:hypothetical protein